MIVYIVVVGVKVVDTNSLKSWYTEILILVGLEY